MVTRTWRPVSTHCRLAAAGLTTRAARGEPSAFAAAWRAPSQTLSARDSRVALALDPPQPARSVHPARMARPLETPLLPRTPIETTSTTSHRPTRLADHSACGPSAGQAPGCVAVVPPIVPRHGVTRRNSLIGPGSRAWGVLRLPAGWSRVRAGG